MEYYDSIITIRGKFSGNVLYHDKGELPCVTYGIIKDKIEGNEGIFNLRRTKHGDYIIFQYLLTNNL